MFTVAHIDHIALTVSDLERSRQWYQDVLGLEHLHPGVWDGVPLLLGAGATSLALFPADPDAPLPLPNPAAAALNRTLSMRHLAFRVDRANFEQAQRDLAQRGIVFSFEDHAICHSIYFADPDGYRLELTTYEL